MIIIVRLFIKMSMRTEWNGIEHSGNGEKVYYENVVQIGDVHDTPVVDMNGCFHKGDFGQRRICEGEKSDWNKIWEVMKWAVTNKKVVDKYEKKMHQIRCVGLD